MEYSGTLSSIVHIIANGEPTKFLVINLRITTFGVKEPVVLVNRVEMSVTFVKCDDDDDDEFVPIKCYECGGEKGKCKDADDLGVEKTCDKGTLTCVVARDEGMVETK